MKQKIKQTLMTIVGLLLSTTAFALDFEVEGIYYNITDATAKTVEVTSGAKKYTGNVTIPPSVTYNSTTYSVTSIGEMAFNDCYGLTSVTIPNSVTEIGSYAFTYCSGLTSVTIPNSVTSIGSSAFGGCIGLTEVTIGNSVTEIGSSAFSSCSGLTSVNISDLSAWCKIDFGDVFANPLDYAGKLYLNGAEIKDLVIPEDITEIKKYAFNGCSGLTSVTIPNSVTSIGYDAFYFCTSLTEVTIGNSVTEIGESAFAGCSNLKIVVNLSNLTFSKGSSKYGYIAYYANKVINAPNGSIVEDFVFSKIDDVNVLIGYFGSATELTLPTDFNGESYTIGSEAFYGCTSLTSIVVAGGNSVYDSRDNCNAIIETATNTLILGCKNTTIPNSVTSIGKWAFYDCSGLTEVTIPNSVISIGKGAFADCSGLTEVTIPNSVASIGEMAFGDCSGLTEVTIGNSVTSIGNYAFYNCDNLRIVKSLNNTPPQCDNYAFGNSTTALLMVPKGSMMSYMLADGWRNFTKIQEFEVDDAVKPVLTIAYPEGGVVKQKVDNGTILELQIVPSNGWKCNSVTFNGVDVTNKLDVDGNYNTPSITADSQLNIVFVKDNSSVTNTFDNNIKVCICGNSVTILGADEFADVEICNTSGINVYNGIEKSITLDANNIYILTVEGRTFKFAM